MPSTGGHAESSARPSYLGSCLLSGRFTACQICAVVPSVHFDAVSRQKSGVEKERCTLGVTKAWVWRTLETKKTGPEF